MSCKSIARCEDCREVLSDDWNGLKCRECQEAEALEWPESCPECGGETVNDMYLDALLCEWCGAFLGGR